MKPRKFKELEAGLPGSQDFCTCEDGKHPKWEHWDGWNQTYTLCHVGGCKCTEFKQSQSPAEALPIDSQSI